MGHFYPNYWYDSEEDDEEEEEEMSTKLNNNEELKIISDSEFDAVLKHFMAYDHDGKSTSNAIFLASCFPTVQYQVCHGLLFGQDSCRYRKMSYFIGALRHKYNGDTDDGSWNEWYEYIFSTDSPWKDYIDKFVLVKDASGKCICWYTRDTELPYAVLLNVCVATRMAHENPGRVKVWQALRDAVGPRTAYMVCSNFLHANGKEDCFTHLNHDLNTAHWHVSGEYETRWIKRDMRPDIIKESGIMSAPKYPHSRALWSTKNLTFNNFIQDRQYKPEVVRSNSFNAVIHLGWQKDAVLSVTKDYLSEIKVSE